MIPIAPEVPTERTAIIVWLLAQGRTFRTSEVANLTGVGRTGAYELMARISRVLPLVLIDDTWQIVQIND